MTLTPQQVHDKQFNTVKMRTGYDMDEVDSFLDEVEGALGALIVENDDLKAQLTQKPAAPVTSAEADKRLADAQAKLTEADRKLTEAQSRIAEAERKAAEADKKAAEADRKLAEAAEREKAAETKLTEARRMATANTVAPGPAPAAAPAAAAAAAAMAAPAVAPPASAGADVPGRALAMLEAAQRTADETVAAAKSEAEALMVKAREDASKVTGKLDEQRASLESKVNDLRNFERSYRAKLRDTISGQLAELDKVTSVEPGAPSGT